MKRIIFETAPEFILLCIVAGIGYGMLQYYKAKNPWGNSLNLLLLVMRAVLVSFIAFLLLGPIVKQINNLLEKPAFIVLHDNSISIREGTDSTTRETLHKNLQETSRLLEEKGYETTSLTLSEDAAGDFSYSGTTSDINSALKRISNRFEGRAVAGVILVSDGIYNSGISPLYSPHNFPVYSIGVGDTSQRADIALKNLSYNKIAYQGNKFPIRAEVQVKSLSTKSLTTSLLHQGKVIARETKPVSNPNQLVVFDFQPVAENQGIQKFDVQVAGLPEESNTRNNRASAFVEVVEGKKKILCIAPSPHPDIKVLAEIIGKNSNYEFRLHIPGIREEPSSVLRSNDIDLVILHQSPDIRGRTLNVFQQFSRNKTSLLLMLGQQTELTQLMRHNMPIAFETLPRDYDEVTPVINPGFSNFIVSPEANTVFSSYPPVSVHYGKINLPLSAVPLLFQRVGSIVTEKPLLAVQVNDTHKIGILLGEGLWRWRLNEYDRTENTEAFDEVFGKLIQFLSTTDEKRRFRSYPVQQEFSETEPVIFESQVYNDIFEPVFGNTIDIEVTHESGTRNEYTYAISPGNIRYQIGGLPEGVYRYRSRTLINEKTEEVRGEFAIVRREAELQNLTADFDLLRNLSSQTGGKFYTVQEAGELQADVLKSEAKALIHTEETYDAIINLKWVFWLLLILVTAEWGLRKYFGTY